MAKKLKKRPKKLTKKTPASGGSDDGYSLPSQKKEPDQDFSSYTFLIYGREKIGKTTLLASFPDCLFFSTEPGTKGLNIFDFNHEDGGVKDWDTFRAAVQLLEKDKSNKFKTIAIDTVDRAYEHCLTWVCEHRGIEYPGTDASGEQDYGKSWRAVKSEFLEQIHRISQTGRGICFTSHSKETEIKTRSGDRYTRIFPTMGNQARTVVEALVDFFFYAEYVKTDKGTARVLICEGDEHIWAGARIEFPRFLPLQKDGYKVLQAAFKGRYKGMDVADIRPSRQTSATAKKLILKAK